MCRLEVATGMLFLTVSFFLQVLKRSTERFPFLFTSREILFFKKATTQFMYVLHIAVSNCKMVSNFSLQVLKRSQRGALIFWPSG